MSFLDPDTVLMAPDSTLLHIPSFTPFRAWPDLWGVGYVHIPLPWFQTENGFLRLRHEHANITMTDPACNPIGAVDPLDWDCARPESRGAAARRSC